MKRWTIRIVGIAMVLTLGGILLREPVKQKQLNRRVKTLLLEVQEGLQKYHVDEEVYPGKVMKGRELIPFLTEGGFLDRKVENPWTQEVYIHSAESDDWLRYRTDELAETYELRALIPESGGTVHFRLDSVENHSLEE